MNCLHFEEIDSTSTYLKTNFSSLPSFSFVSSSFQSAGRGRTGRSWVGEKGKNLLFSFLIKDDPLLPLYKDISLACAYVLAKTIENLYGLKPSIKWPNDVYLSHKKMCGILLESHMSDGKIDGLIVGIGINVNQMTYPKDLIYPVTSIALETGHEESLDALKEALFSALENYLKSLPGGEKAHIAYANGHNELLNKEVYASILGEKKLVKALSIEPNCDLLIESDGQKQAICSGEISFHI